MGSTICFKRSNVFSIKKWQPLQRETKEKMAELLPLENANLIHRNREQFQACENYGNESWLLAKVFHNICKTSLEIPSFAI